MPESPKTPLHHVHHFFVPHEGNDYKPKAIGFGSLTVLLVFVLVVEAGYVFDTQVLFTKSTFLASVVPSVLIVLTNQERAVNGVGQLTENPLLDEAAQMKANDEAQKGYFAHVSPDGTEPWYWINKAGYSYIYAGENLAINFDDSTQVEDAWMNSPTHRANILKPEYTDIGIATAEGVYEGQETTFVVQYFASPGPATATPAPVQVVSTTSNLAAQTVPASVGAAQTPSILGAQTQPAHSPTATLAEKSASTSTSTALAPTTPAPRVQVPPASAQNGLAAFFGPILAAPVGAATYALVALLVLSALLFIIALVAHLRMPYLEALGATFAVFTIVVGLLVVNATQSPRVDLPVSNLSASVINSR